MTARDRNATGVLANAAPLVSTPRAAADGVRPLAWEDWFAHSAPAQQLAILELAVRQGMVFAHQVPPASNGVKNGPSSTRLPEPGDKFASFLSGKTDALEPFAVPSITCVDAGLDPMQQEAVARALGTPDLFLLRGLPGSGKSRVLAELLTQAALDGQRVLFLAPHAAAVDVVLERIALRDAVFALRFLEAGEAAAAVSPAVWACTYAERLRSFQTSVRGKAAHALADMEERCRGRQTEEPVWERLRRVASERQEVHERLAEVRRRQDDIAAEVERLATLEQTVADTAGAAADTGDANPFVLAMQSLRQRRQQAHEELAAQTSTLANQRQALVLELEQLERALDSLRPSAEAKRLGRWWSMGWWRATLGSQSLRLYEEQENCCTQLRDKIADLDGRSAKLAEEQRSCAAKLDAERTILVSEECRRRRQELLDQESGLVAKLRNHDAAWAELEQTLDHSVRPSAPSASAVDEAHAKWQATRRHDDEGRAFAQRWAEYLDGAGVQMAARLPAWANVLAGTITALAKDASFVEATREPFDLVVLEEAEHLTEAEFQRLSRLGRRCVLVGEIAPPPQTKTPGKNELRPGCFSKLWSGLCCDSPRLHANWRLRPASTNGAAQRWCCEFRTVQGEERKNLEIERLVDYPEIEVGILTTANAPPVLAEVAFPAGMNVLEAKEFIVRELQEPALDGFLQGAWLSEATHAYSFHLSASGMQAGPVGFVELTRGVREAVALSKTHYLEFAKDTGWTRPLVDQWLQRHLHVRDLGRTMFLQTSYRFRANSRLGLFVDSCLGSACCPAPAHRDQAAIEFIPVPAPRKDKGNGPAALPKEGAGLEQDLAGVRLGDRLPVDARAGLPRTGIVNYLEAQAIVKALEERAHSFTGGPVAVIAVQEAQAELLRRLVAASEPLRQKAVAIEVGVPRAFRQREFATVFLSLTRSHSHRAVSYGAYADLALALTRASKELVICGDLGALAKRKQWRGPLDNLDAAAADREATLIASMVQLLHIPSLASARG